MPEDMDLEPGEQWVANWFGERFGRDIWAQVKAELVKVKSMSVARLKDALDLCVGRVVELEHQRGTEHATQAVQQLDGLTELMAELRDIMRPDAPDDRDADTVLRAVTRLNEPDTDDDDQEPVQEGTVELDAGFFEREIQILKDCPYFTEVKCIGPDDPEARDEPSGTSNMFNHGGPRVEVTTRPLVVSDAPRSDHVVTFPPFKFVIYLTDNLSERIRRREFYSPIVVGVAPGHEPNEARERRMWHPHIERGGSMCAGAGGRVMRNQFTAGGLSDMFITLFQTLDETYMHEGFNDLRNWDDSVPRCRVCRGELEGHENVECASTGHEIHLACAKEVNGQYYVPDQVYVCSSCTEHKVRATQEPTRLSDQIEICPDCPHALHAHEQAEQGTYVCPNCQTAHECTVDQGHLISASHAVVPLRNGWAGCTSCLTELPERGRRGELQLRVDREGKLFGPVGQVVSAFDPRTRVARYLPTLKKQALCQCGAHYDAEQVHTDMFGISTVCPVCDPDHLLLSKALLADIQHLNLVLRQFMATQVDDFTLDFVSVLDLVESEVPLEQAQGIACSVQSVMAGHKAAPPWVSMPLKDYIQSVNDLTSDVSVYPLMVINATPEEVDFYDEEVRRRNPRAFDVPGEDDPDEDPEEPEYDDEEYDEEHDDDEEYGW